MENSFLENKYKAIQLEYSKIVKDFNNTLKHRLESYYGTILSRVSLENMQMDIDQFIHKHNLDINIIPIRYDDTSVVFLGRTIKDSMIWESITSKNYE